MNLNAGDTVYIAINERTRKGRTCVYSFNLSFVATNKPPTFSSSPVTSATAGVNYVYNVNANDPDAGDTVTLSAPTLPGWLTMAGNTLSGLPGGAEAGNTYNVVLRATDNNGAFTEQSFTISVTAPASTPPITAPDTATTDRLTPVAINVLTNDQDDNGDGAIDPTTVLIESAPANGATAVDPVTGAVTYTPVSPFDPLAIGVPDTFTYSVADVNGHRSLPAVVSVTVNAGPNTPPVANDKTFDTSQGVAINGNLITGLSATSGSADSDADGDILTMSSWNLPSKGALTGLSFNSDGSFTYMPFPGLSGTDTFTYTIKDSYGGTATATVTINIAVALADLSIVKSASKTTLSATEGFTYTLTVASAPFSPFNPYTDAYNVVVSDTLPSGVIFNGFAAVPAGWNCEFSAGDVTCTAATVSAGFAGNIIINAFAPVVEGNITNTATITADTPDPDTANNTSSFTNEVLATSADVSISMSASPNPAPTASTLTYTLQVTNNGPDDTSNVEVRATLPNNVQFVSVDGGSDWTCSQGLLVICDYTANSFTLTSGTTADDIVIKVTTPPEDDTVAAQASVSASVLDPDLSNNSDSETVTVNFQTITGGSIPMTKYLQYNLFGDMKLVGNANVNFSGTDPNQNYNDNVNMRYVDTDGVSSTFNSSSSTLTLPDPSYEILWAGLYWSGHICSDSSTGNGDGSGTGCDWSNSNYNSYNKADDHIGEVLLATPNSGGYMSITANTVNIVNYGSVAGIDKAYTAFADITRFIDPAETGTYTVANMILSEGQIGGGGNFGGWGILFIYEDPANGVQFKNVSVFNGFQSIQSDNNPIAIDGFVTPLSGPVTASIAFLATDGDPVSGGVARMREGTSNNYDYVGGSNASPTDTINVTGNLFNSTVAELGSHINPGVTKTYGLDVDRVDVSRFMDNGQTDTRFLFDVSTPTGGVDWYNLSMFAFATDLVTPVIDNFDKNVSIVDQNGTIRAPGIGVPIYPGSELIYTLTFTNTGDEIAQQVEIFDDFDFDYLTPYLNLSSFDLSKLKLSYANSTNWQTTPNCGYDAGDHKVWCRLPQVDIGDTYKMQFSVNVTSNNPVTDVNLTNTAYSTYRNPTTGTPVVLVSNSHGNFGGQSNTLNAGTFTSLGGGGGGNIVPGAADIISLVGGTVPTQSDYNNNISRYISTKIAAKSPTSITAVHLDETTHLATAYSSGAVNAALNYIVMPFMSDGTCTSMERLIDPNTGQQSVIEIPNTYSGASVQDATFKNGDVIMPSRAEKDARFMMVIIDPTKLSSAGQQCILSSSTTGNFARVSQCANSEVQYRTAFGDDAWDRCGDSSGRPCLSNNHGVANVNDPSYNPATDHIYANDLGCYICTFNIQPACSTDNFALRPDRFVINSSENSYPDLLRAEGDYNVSIDAYDFDRAGHVAVNTIGYDQNSTALSASDTKWLSTDTIDTGGLMAGGVTFGSQPYEFNDGVTRDFAGNSPEVVDVGFTDVGQITMTISDTEWAGVDINNPLDLTPEDCTDEAAYICGEQNMTFIPDHFKVEVNDIHNGNAGDTFTYLGATDLNMSVSLDVTFTAEGAADGAMTNFDMEPGLYENPVTVLLNIKQQHNGDIAETHDIATEQLIDFVEGVKTIPWDETDESLKLLFNYPRYVDQPVNPFEVNGSMAEVDINSTYTGSAPEDTAHIDGEGNNSNDSVLFIYGRAHSPRFRVPCDVAGTAPCSTDNARPVKVYYEFYYFVPGSFSIDANTTVPISGSMQALTDDDNRSTDSITWFVNTLHTAADGNITATAPKVNALVSDGTYTDINGMTLIPYTYNGQEGYPYKSTIQISTYDWLIYNRFDAAATVNEYELEFNNRSGTATGVNEANTSIDSDANINTSRRIQW